MAARTYRGTAELPPGGIWTEMNALGKAMPSMIGSREVRVLLPALEADVDENGMSGLGSPFDEAVGDLRWGGGDADEEALYVQVLGIELDDDAEHPQTLVDDLAGSVDLWAQAVLDWLTAWSRQPIHEEFPFTAAVTAGERLTLWTLDGAEPVAIKGRSLWTSRLMLDSPSRCSTGGARANWRALVKCPLSLTASFATLSSYTCVVICGDPSSSPARPSRLPSAKH